MIDRAVIDRLNSLKDHTVVGPATVKKVFTEGSLSWNGREPGPVILHEKSGLDRNTYAIARCIASEVGSSRHASALLSVAEAVRNSAKAKGIEPYQLLVVNTSAAYKFTQYWYGEQHGRWAATSRDPTKRTVEVARLVQSSQTNLTNDGRRWFAPKVQDAGKQGERKLSYDAIGIAEKWGAEGDEWIGPLPGVATYEHAVFRKAGRPVDNRRLIDVIKLGRAGKPTVGTDSEDPATVAVAEQGIPWWAIAVGGIFIV